MCNIVICDDEKEICQQIGHSIVSFQEKSGEQFEISYRRSSEELLRRWEEDTDLLLLDIKMAGMSGMNAARELRRRGSNVLIIFITTMISSALEGYEVHAYGFMKKPLNEIQFHWQLADALKTIRKAKGKTIFLNTNFKSDIINSNEIIYAESFGHDIQLKLTNGRCITHCIPLRELEKQLPTGSFFAATKAIWLIYSILSILNRQSLCLKVT